MGKPQRRPRMHDGHTRNRRKWRLRNNIAGFDQIDKNLKEKQAELLHQEIDLDKPGFAQNFCLHCDKYFMNDRAMQDHFKTKVHKRRMKALEDEPYTMEESYKAAGHGSYVGPQKRKMETQPSREEYAEGKRIKVEVETPQEKVEREMTKRQRRSLNKSMEVDAQNTIMSVARA